MEHTVYLALGTNMGDREANLRRALEAMAPAVEVTQTSPVYETAPWGVTDQDDFLNQVVRAQTSLKPDILLSFLKSIEAQLGREDSRRWGPRLIDLDILFYDDLVLEMEHLTIPHPHLHERAFVLVPLADLEPELRHPVLNQTIGEILKEVDQEGITAFIS